jgi:outer membrane protein OmpA-like peptidoglycan-associated protein
LAGLALVAASATVAAADEQALPGRPPPQRRNFIACPILQDTSTVPCWLADYQGERYFLGIQTDSGGWSPPYLGHQVLVEGKVVPGPRICGGIPLTSDYPQSPLPSGSADGQPLPNPPVVSPLRELDASCNTLLPADPQYHIAGRRGPGPNTAASALRPPPQPVSFQAPTPPFRAQTYTLTYEFDSEVAARSVGEALKAVQYANAIHARQFNIVGYRGATLLSDGTLAQELPAIGERRAAELAAAVRKLGIAQTTLLTARGSSDPQPADGSSDPLRRRAEITVVP